MQTPTETSLECSTHTILHWNSLAATSRSKFITFPVCFEHGRVPPAESKSAVDQIYKQHLSKMSDTGCSPPPFGEDSYAWPCQLATDPITASAFTVEWPLGASRSPVLIYNWKSNHSVITDGSHWADACLQYTSARINGLMESPWGCGTKGHQ